MIINLEKKNMFSRELYELDLKELRSLGGDPKVVYIPELRGDRYVLDSVQKLGAVKSPNTGAEHLAWKEEGKNPYNEKFPEIEDGDLNNFAWVATRDFVSTPDLEGLRVLKEGVYGPESTTLSVFLESLGVYPPPNGEEEIECFWLVQNDSKKYEKTHGWRVLRYYKLSRCCPLFTSRIDPNDTWYHAPRLDHAPKERAKLFCDWAHYLGTKRLQRALSDIDRSNDFGPEDVPKPETTIDKFDFERISEFIVKYAFSNPSFYAFPEDLSKHAQYMHTNGYFAEYGKIIDFIAVFISKTWIRHSQIMRELHDTDNEAAAWEGILGHADPSSLFTPIPMLGSKGNPYYEESTKKMLQNAKMIGKKNPILGRKITDFGRDVNYFYELLALLDYEETPIFASSDPLERFKKFSEDHFPLVRSLTTKQMPPYLKDLPFVKRITMQITLHLRAKPTFANYWEDENHPWRVPEMYVLKKLFFANKSPSDEELETFLDVASFLRGLYPSSDPHEKPGMYYKLDEKELVEGYTYSLSFRPKEIRRKVNPFDRITVNADAEMFLGTVEGDSYCWYYTGSGSDGGIVDCVEKNFVASGKILNVEFPSMEDGIINTGTYTLWRIQWLERDELYYTSEGTNSYPIIRSEPLLNVVIYEETCGEHAPTYILRAGKDNNTFEKLYWPDSLAVEQLLQMDVPRGMSSKSEPGDEGRWTMKMLRKKDSFRYLLEYFPKELADRVSPEPEGAEENLSLGIREATRGLDDVIQKMLGYMDVATGSGGCAFLDGDYCALHVPDGLAGNNTGSSILCEYYRTLADLFILKNILSRFKQEEIRGDAKDIMRALLAFILEVVVKMELTRYSVITRLVEAMKGADGAVPISDTFLLERLKPIVSKYYPYYELSIKHAEIVWSDENEKKQKIGKKNVSAKHFLDVNTLAFGGSYGHVLYECFLRHHSAKGFEAWYPVDLLRKLEKPTPPPTLVRPLVNPDVTIVGAGQHLYGQKCVDLDWSVHERWDSEGRLAWWLALVFPALCVQDNFTVARTKLGSEWLSHKTTRGILSWNIVVECVDQNTGETYDAHNSSWGDSIWPDDSPSREKAEKIRLEATVISKLKNYEDKTRMAESMSEAAIKARVKDLENKRKTLPNDEKTLDELDFWKDVDQNYGVIERWKRIFEKAMERSGSVLERDFWRLTWEKNFSDNSSNYEWISEWYRSRSQRAKLLNVEHKYPATITFTFEAVRFEPPGASTDDCGRRTHPVFDELLYAARKRDPGIQITNFGKYDTLRLTLGTAVIENEKTVFESIVRGRESRTRDIVVPRDFFLVDKTVNVHPKGYWIGERDYSVKGPKRCNFTSWMTKNIEKLLNLENYEEKDLKNAETECRDKIIWGSEFVSYSDYKTQKITIQEIKNGHYALEERVFKEVAGLFEAKRNHKDWQKYFDSLKNIETSENSRVESYLTLSEAYK